MDLSQKRILILKKLNEFTNGVEINILSRKNWGYTISKALEQLQKEYPKELFYPYYYIEFGEIKTYKFLFFNIAIKLIFLFIMKMKILL